jgi:heptosyltransferase I
MNRDAVPGWTGKPPREICIVMLSAIGDAVHVLPVASALKRTWPECRITWVIQPAPYALVAGHPAIDDFVLFRRRRGWSAWRSFLEVRRAIRGRSFDLLLGLQVYFKAGLVTATADAKVKLGFDWTRARDAQWLFTNRRIPKHEPQHVQDQYFEFLNFIGIDPSPVRWGIELSDEERSAQRSFYAQIDRPACGIVVGTSKQEKNWSVAGYARLLETLEDTHGLQPVIVGSPARSERQLAEEIIRETRATPINALGDNLRRLVWLIEGAALLVSPDTGPLHISRALDTPVVSLFGYTNPKRTGPYRAFEDLVVDGYAEYEGEPYQITPRYRDGMKRVTTERVLDKVALAMTKYVPNRGSED